MPTSEPLWCDVRQHYCRCHDFGERCDDYGRQAEERYRGATEAELDTPAAHPITQKPGELATAPQADTLGSGLTAGRDPHQRRDGDLKPDGN